jgi:REP element-mobilizing transposase RayT
MPKSYTNLLYHIIFSTRDRRPLITSERRKLLYEYVGGTIRGLGGISLAIGGIEDHIHLLAKLRPDKALSELLRDLKSNSSGWMHDVFPDAKDFAWQHGYGAFTVSASQVRAVSRYIADQERHHRNRSFRDEFVEILRIHEIEFDEKYLWK